ncbi:MAG TPA: NAD-dependent DNA ligase LigA [Saprospiraceae bacterium]|nr:NAD-dependent DNA ligase LigA [Saprospiraceae bacterium]
MYSPEQQKTFFDLSKALLEKEVTEDDIIKLRDVISFHEWKYYIENNPVIADYEFDLLFKKLQQLEKVNPLLITPDSPTQRVSNDLTEEFHSVEHLIPMLSLDNSYSAEDLLEFDKQVKKLCRLEPSSTVEYTVEPKYDGGSIAIVYEKDILVRAATRGNGFMGEDMTPNARVIQSIPLRAPFTSLGIHTAELRGEALIAKEVFKTVNEQREKEGLSLFANPRNAATGGLRTKDPSETRKRGLEAFIFQFGYAVDVIGNDLIPTLGNHHTSILKLGDLGFKIPREEIALCKGINEAIQFCKYWEEKRETFPYEIDGMVVKVNDYLLQAQCGSTAHHPRWAIAYKFKAKQATTKLIAIEYQVGKIGSITPVAKLQPVSLAGVTVSSVSLHNEEFIRSRDLRIGDTVIVERAGDVIPYIVKPLEELRDGSEVEVEFPRICPVNHTGDEVPLIQMEGEAAWRCVDCRCGAQDLQKMIFHVSKDAMDIDGFGKSYVERFYELGWLKDISDIYHLDYKAIEQLEGFGVKSAENLANAIEKAKKNPITRLLHSLSIHHMGKKASRLIAEQIDHVMELTYWTEEQLIAIKDIGPVVARNVVNYFSQKRNISMLQRMEERGVNLSRTMEDLPTKVSAEAPLAGKTILFTGSLQKLGRKEAQEEAEKLGAKNISAVSGNLNILVVGENAGSKLTKAQQLGTVEIWSEDDFISLINGSL